MAFFFRQYLPLHITRHKPRHRQRVFYVGALLALSVPRTPQLVIIFIAGIYFVRKETQTR